MKKTRAFTLMEIMVVIVIIGLLSGLGVANYIKSQEQAYKKNVYSQLRMIHQAQEWYRVKNHGYYPFPMGAGPITSVAAINDALDIYLIPASDLSYQCFILGAAGLTYRCTATRSVVEGVSDYVFQVDQNPLSDTNPSCTAGAKPCP